MKHIILQWTDLKHMNEEPMMQVTDISVTEENLLV